MFSGSGAPGRGSIVYSDQMRNLGTKECDVLLDHGFCSTTFKFPIGSHEREVVKEMTKNGVPPVLASRGLRPAQWQQCADALIRMTDQQFFKNCPALEGVYWCCPGGPVQTVVCVFNPISCVFCIMPMEEAKKKCVEICDPILRPLGFQAAARGSLQDYICFEPIEGSNITPISVEQSRMAFNQWKQLGFPSAAASSADAMGMEEANGYGSSLNMYGNFTPVHNINTTGINPYTMGAGAGSSETKMGELFQPMSTSGMEVQGNDYGPGRSNASTSFTYVS
ncbi:unnamed protein product [Amoebophrya sp. A120]|nr:unnamed protein product [Amoebophrya sp. A120]|eukprot:GSA120T00005398001.1